MKKIQLLLLLLISLSLPAQIANPVKWHFTQKNTSHDEAELIFTAKIDNNWHLYGTDIPEGGPIATSFHFVPSDEYVLSGTIITKDKAALKYDPNFDMHISLFSNKVVFVQKIKILSTKTFHIKGHVEFMACDDKQCIPPQEEDFVFTIATEAEHTPSVETPDSSVLLTTVAEKKDTAITSLVHTSTLPKDTDSSSLLLFLLISFLSGLAGLLTPCVFPMIPMTVSFFMQKNTNRLKSVSAAMAYGVSIVAIYSAIGAIVSFAGAGFANTLSTHWIPNTVFFLLFVLFAISFFGAFEIVLPSSLINSSDRRAEKGGLIGTFFMALTFVIVSFSCTGPIVSSLLIEAATGGALKPILGMFGFSLGLAIPFSLLAIFPSWLSKLPKSGGWLHAVKVVLAFVLLAFSLKFISTIDQIYHLNIMPRGTFIICWISISIMLSLYLLGAIRLPHDSPTTHIGIIRMFLALLSIAFTIYLLTGLFGAPLRKINALLPPAPHRKVAVMPASAQNNTICGTPQYSDLLHLPYGLQGYFEYKQGMQCAAALNKPALIIFKGHACSNCKEMETKVWSDSRVLNSMRNKYVLIALYVDDRTALPENEWIISAVDGKVKNTIGKVNADLQISKFHSISQPFYAIVNPNGQLLKEPMGKTNNVEEFLRFLE